MRISHFPISDAEVFLRKDVELALVSRRLDLRSLDILFMQIPATEIMKTCNTLQNTLSDFQR